MEQKAHQCRKAILLMSKDLKALISQDDARATTSAITKAIVRACKELGARVDTEVDCGKFENPRWKRKSRSGRVDIVASFQDGSSLAIEIDRGNKRFSVEKLESMRQRGVATLWVRWGGTVRRISREIPVCVVGR